MPKSAAPDDRQIMTIRCPHCGSESHKTIAWIRSHADLQCAACGEKFRLHRTKIRKALDAIIQPFDNLRRKLDY
jgi:transcription elongation factor Elf1